MLIPLTNATSFFQYIAGKKVAEDDFEEIFDFLFILY